MENAKHAAQERPIAKRLVTFVTAVAACVALAAGGTLAYFSAEETAHNVITTGGVDIELVEKAYAGVDDQGNAVYVDFEDVSGVMPGETISKIVTVENTGKSAAWVRVKVVKSFESEGGAAELDDTAIGIDFDSANWAEKDGWYYYAHQLPAYSAENPDGHVTSPLFTEVSFAAGMDNAYQGGKAIVTVSAQAVQVANNGASAQTASGWPQQ